MVGSAIDILGVFTGEGSLGMGDTRVVEESWGCRDWLVRGRRLARPSQARGCLERRPLGDQEDEMTGGRGPRRRGLDAEAPGVCGALLAPAPTSSRQLYTRA